MRACPRTAPSPARPVTSRRARGPTGGGGRSVSRSSTATRRASTPASRAGSAGTAAPTRSGRRGCGRCSTRARWARAQPRRRRDPCRPGSRLHARRGVRRRCGGARRHAGDGRRFEVDRRLRGDAELGRVLRRVRDALARGDRAAARAIHSRRSGARRSSSARATAACATRPELHERRVPRGRGAVHARRGRVDPGRHGGIKRLQGDRFNLLGKLSDDASGASATKTRRGCYARTSASSRRPASQRGALTAPYMLRRAARRLARRRPALLGPRHGAHPRPRRAAPAAARADARGERGSGCVSRVARRSAGGGGLTGYPRTRAAGDTRRQGFLHPAARIAFRNPDPPRHQRGGHPRLDERRLRRRRGRGRSPST